MSKKVKMAFFALILIFLMGSVTVCFGEYKITSYKPIDISLKCNMGFIDDVPNNREGGWTDDGPLNDFRNFPTGRQNFNGVPFEIIEPKNNDYTSCIVLKSKTRAYFPESAKDIKVGYPAKKLHFVHALSQGDEKPGKYVVNYDDGSTMFIPLENRYNTYSWWYTKDFKLGAAKTAWTGKNKRHSPIAVYHYIWENPFPEKVIKSLDFLSSNSKASPILVAVTAEIEKPAADFNLSGQKTEIERGEDIVLKVFARNLIPENMTTQAIIIPPEGWKIVNSSNFTKSGVGQYSTTFMLQPGMGKELEVKIKSREIGQFEVKGLIVYQFGDPPGEDHSEVLPPIDVTVLKPESEPGFEAVFAIVGFLTVAYLTNRRKRG